MPYKVTTVTEGLHFYVDEQGVHRAAKLYSCRATFKLCEQEPPQVEAGNTSVSVVATIDDTPFEQVCTLIMSDHEAATFSELVRHDTQFTVFLDVERDHEVNIVTIRYGGKHYEV